MCQTNKHQHYFLVSQVMFFYQIQQKAVEWEILCQQAVEHIICLVVVEYRKRYTVMKTKAYLSRELKIMFSIYDL